MAVFDLADVTRTLIWMLKTRIPALGNWPPLVELEVSPLPPDRLRASTNLGLYLYHLTEDAHYKNLPGAAPEQRPVALNLYYQLTAQVGDADADALRAQLLMGAAVRVLHDFPLITDSTTLEDSAGTSFAILAHRGLQGRGNRIRITLRPVPVDDGVDYWTAGDAPLRLAAYYQVSVILLDAEPTASVAPAVLSYGSGVFATGAPQLSGSRATLSIVVAESATPSAVVVQPAQVTLGERFQLEGNDLIGESTTLRLRDARGTRLVDSTLWAVVASSSTVFATVAEMLGDGELLPGSLGASVVVSRPVVVGGSPRNISHSSNETPIVITPRLDRMSATGPTLGSAAAGATLTWTGWRFVHDDIPVEERDPQAVHLYLGDRLLSRVEGTPAPGQYSIVDASTLSVCLPADLVSGSTLPVRVGVRGVYSSPLWLGVT